MFPALSCSPEKKILLNEKSFKKLIEIFPLTSSWPDFRAYVYNSKQNKAINKQV